MNHHIVLLTWRHGFVSAAETHGVGRAVRQELKMNLDAAEKVYSNVNVFLCGRYEGVESGVKTSCAKQWRHANITKVRPTIACRLVQGQIPSDSKPADNFSKLSMHPSRRKRRKVSFFGFAADFKRRR